MTLAKTTPESVIAKLKEALALAPGLTADFHPRPVEQVGHTIWYLECVVTVADGTPQEVVDRSIEAIERIVKECGGVIGDFEIFPQGRYPNPEEPIQRVWTTVIWESLR